VQFIVAVRARYVSVEEIGGKIPPLFESLHASEEVPRKEEEKTAPDYRARPTGL
jgi:hypothetical protein